jgi:hypothetical protein
MKFTFKDIVADPLTAMNDYESSDIAITFNRPVAGISLTTLQQRVAGCLAWLDATMVGKIYGLES